MKPDVINSHGSLNSRFAAWFVGVPARIYTRHCVYPVSKLYKLLPVRYITGAVTERLSHGIIAVAHSAKKNLTDMGIKKDKIRVIINGAEPLKAINLNEREILKNSLGIEKDDIVVSIFARLEPCKDHKSFLKAAALLTHSSTNYKFLILGSGSIEHELKQYARRLRVDKNVRFLGFVDDIAPFMNITDINVNCSIGTETSSLALSEGMSLGVPAVVSDYGGNPYMVSEGENGYVYPQGDYGSLAMLIKRIAKMKGSEEYKSLSSGAYERYKNELNAKSMTEKTEEFYKELYKRKKPRR